MNEKQNRNILSIFLVARSWAEPELQVIYQILISVFVILFIFLILTFTFSGVMVITVINLQTKNMFAK